MTDRWLPLESNPDVMNKYVRQLGLRTSKWRFVDVFSFDEDTLSFVPRPVVAILLLYPLTEKTESIIIGEEVSNLDGLYFIRQTISNACGTIGIIHALCNNAKTLGFKAGKHLKSFLDNTLSLTPEERGKQLELDNVFGEFHEEVANEGQSEVPSRDDSINLHFVAFVHHKNVLYELDGRRDGPVSHGSTSEESFLENTITVVKEFMRRDPDNLNFTLVALVKNQD